MNELKPCPFCGRERPSIGIRCVIGERAWRVHCICGAVGGPWPRREDEDFGTQDEAIAAWNTRKHAQEDAAQEEDGLSHPSATNEGAKLQPNATARLIALARSIHRCGVFGAGAARELESCLVAIDSEAK